MKPAHLLSVAVSLLLSCDPADFSGAYSGTFTSQGGSCTDGETTPPGATATADWNIAETGDVLSIASNGFCGTMYADASGNTATIRPAGPCDVTTDQFTATASLTGGTLTLDGHTLSASYSASVTIYPDGGNPSAITCGYTYDGTLTKS